MTKINRILQDWPSGTVVSSDWLKSRGVGKHLVDSYVKSQWLERVGRGALKRKGDVISWEGVVCSLQTHFNRFVHPGGRTSLELQGLGHFVRMREDNKVILWKTPDVRVPSWIHEPDPSVRYRIRSSRLFSREIDAYTEHKTGPLSFLISSPERAVFELLYDVPEQESFEDMHHIFQGLSTLRPRVLQELLRTCTSIKVKRLFLYLSEISGHVWADKLDPSEVDLGKGKRVIVKGGKFNSKYRITVPANQPEF
ncbi:MAG: type IV toxin-antitoxin system AbiEi family antitoxin [Balneolales bacterium]